MASAFSPVPAAVRRLSLAALGVALLHIIFGAIVRISGSGMGCGDHWPTCYGYWIPPFERMDLVIEVMHRYLALALFVAVASLAVAAWRHRAAPGVGGAGGVWPAARVAVALWFAPALFGAVTVFTGNPAWATVVHKLLAASLLAVLVAAALRAGALGRASVPVTGSRAATGSAIGGATAAAGLALVVVLLGGLTAKVEGAAVACAGFPLCGPGSLGGGAQHLQLTHRVMAYLLVLHLLALPFLFRRRGEPAPLQRWAWAGGALGVLQVVWAAWMVTGGFPGVVRSLHQATGILIWVAAVAMTLLARMAAGTPAPSPATGMAGAGRAAATPAPGAA